MAAKLDLVPLPPFDPLHEPSSLSQRWKNWTKRFQTYVAAMNITDDKREHFSSTKLAQQPKKFLKPFPTLETTTRPPRKSSMPIFRQRRMLTMRYFSSGKLCNNQVKVLINLPRDCER